MTEADELRHKAAKCRRLAGEITRVADPTKVRLLQLAAEFDNEAAARSASVLQPPAPASPLSPGHRDGRR